MTQTTMFVFKLERGKVEEFPYCLTKGTVYVTLHDEYITKGEKYIHHYPITTGAEELAFNLVHDIACQNCSLSSGPS